MDRMAILAKMQKRHEGKSERGGVATTPPPLLRERVKLLHKTYIFSWFSVISSSFDRSPEELKNTFGQNQFRKSFMS